MSYPLVLCIGELLWDLLPSGRVIGGAPANCALRLKSLGVNSKLISRVGADSLGNEALIKLSQLEMDHSLVQIDPELPTGTVGVTINKDGNPSFEIHKHVAYDNIEFTEAVSVNASPSLVICYGTLVQRSANTQKTLYELLNAAPNAYKILDINLRKDCFTKSTVESSLLAANAVKLNVDEVKKLQQLLEIPYPSNQEFCDMLIKRFSLDIVIVTLGENGAEARSSKKESFYAQGRKVNVVDTVGSGDAFTAGFIHGFLQDLSVESSLEFGNALGALSATKTGGMSPISKIEFEKFLDKSIS